MSGTLHVSRPATGVVLIEIDCPPSNALGTAVRERFVEELGAVDADLDVRALIITGRGKGFCAGDDLREAQSRGAEGRGGGQASLAQFGRLLDAVEGLRVPVIAAVNGHAMGGGLELALCCDIRIASSTAVFQGAGVNVGLMASVYRLPRLIGIGPAKAMLLTGLPTDAATALSYGLITALHEPEALMTAALALAERIATRAPLSVEAAKRMIGQAFDLSPQEAQRASGEELRMLAGSEDHKAALKAFFAREAAVFKRR
jgi:enoyl-CoA hydratase/carnithine racemase